MKVVQRVCVAVGVYLLVPGCAHIEKKDSVIDSQGLTRIDLAPERAEYEEMARRRTVGLSLLAGTLALAGGSAYAYSQASSARTDLMAQRTPVNLAQRQQLVSSGVQANAIGLVAMLLGIGAGISSTYLLLVSF